MIRTAAEIALIILLASVVIAFVRLRKGPSVPDRVISLDLIATLAMGMIITFTFISEKIVYLDVVLIVALMLFLGTCTIAKYLRKKGTKR